MKKKIISLVLIISLLAVVFSGCSILSKNTERDGQTILATISYGGLESTLTKAELTEYFLANGGTYIQYYGMTPEQVLDLFKESLTNSKLNVLKARVELSLAAGIPSGSPIVDLLTKAEKKKAIDEANKIFEDAYNELVKEVQKEQDLLNKPEEEEEEEEKEEDTHTHDSRLTPRTAKTKVDPEFDADAVIEGDLPKSFLETVEPANDNGKEALRRLKNNLKESKKDYTYYLDKQHESLLLDHYKRVIIEKAVTVTDAEIEVRYNKIFDDNKALYANFSDNTIDKDKYLTAIKTDGAGNKVINKQGYVFVKQILIKFSDKQLKEIEAYEKSINNETATNQFRMNMVNNILTNVSNTDYDAEKDCIGYIVENGVTTDVKYDVTVDTHPIDHKCSADGKANADGTKKELCPLYAFTELDISYSDIINRILTDVNAAETVKDKIAAFDKWIYLVNDDTGMFNSKAGYCITPEGEKSEFVESFTELGRALSKQPVGTFAIPDADIDATKFTLKNFVGSGNNGNITMAISTFGIHLMMSIQNPNDGKDNTTTLGGYSVIGLDYLVDHENNKTLKELLKEAILKEKKADAYSYSNIDFITNNKNSIVYIDKNYNKIVKEINKLYNV